METDSIIVYIKTDDIYKGIAEYVETRFDTSNYGWDRQLTNFLIDDVSKDKKPEGTKTYVIKRKLKFENFKVCLEATHLENKINYLEKNKINIDSIKKKS